MPVQNSETQIAGPSSEVCYLGSGDTYDSFEFVNIEGSLPNGHATFSDAFDFLESQLGDGSGFGYFWQASGIDDGRIVAYLENLDTGAFGCILVDPFSGHAEYWGG